MDAVNAPLFRTTLERHPADRGPSIASVRAEVFQARDDLRVAFDFSGALEHLALPAAVLDPAKLWEHTCAELFVAGEDGRYVEWNLSPTGQATRFEFSAYRSRTSASFNEDVQICVTREALSVQLVASGPLLRGLDRVACASLSAVVRSPGGACSYWALKHPGPDPDFHDVRGFTLSGHILSP